MNKLCSYNHTYAITNLNDDALASIKDNKYAIGLLGKKLDDLLVKRHLRKCKLIGENIRGERLDNGTWTGNLGLIQKGEAILYLRNEAPLVDLSTEKWLYYLNSFHREKFLIVEDIKSYINKASKKENISDVLNCFNFDLIFLILFIMTTLLSYLILILSGQNKKRKLSIKKRIKNIFNSKHKLNYSKISRMSIILLFCSLYLWFIQLIIANNIKTNKVLVDHSILIKDENDALNTKKTFCLFEGETELSIALSSNYSNILAKLYNQKNFLPRPIKEANLKIRDRCIVRKSLEVIDTQTDDLFTILSENAIWLMLSVVNKARNDVIIWLNPKPIFEMNFHLAIKNQKYLIDQYNQIMLYYNQAGISTKSMDFFSPILVAFFQSHTVYMSVKDFINENTIGAKQLSAVA